MLLHKESFVPTHNGYMILPMTEINLDVQYSSGTQNIKISTPQLISGNDCRIFTNKLALPLQSIKKYNKTIISNTSYDLQFIKNDADLLSEHLIKLPQIINLNDIRNARLNLDDTESILSKIKNHRRLSSWSQTANTILSYARYLSIS